MSMTGVGNDGSTAGGATLPWSLACERRLRCITICTTRSLNRSSTHTLQP